jgi:hypothetical protein
MKYAVVKVVNSAYSIHSEGWLDLEKAKVNYFDLCKTLHNASDVQTACCMIIDESLNNVEGYREYINHTRP